MMLQKAWLIVLAVLWWPISLIWRRHPAAMLEQAILQQTRELGAANETLAQSNGQARTMKRRVAKLTSDKTILEQRIRRQLANGETDKATRNGARLVDIEAQLKRAQADLEAATKVLAASTQHVEQARDALESFKRDAESGKIRLQSAKTRETMVRTLSAVRSGLDNSVLRDAAENLEREIDQAEGRADTIASLNGVDDDLDEAEELKNEEVAKVLDRLREPASESVGQPEEVSTRRG